MKHGPLRTALITTALAAAVAWAVLSAFAFSRQAALGLTAAPRAPVTVPTDARYPYHSDAFTGLVRESYADRGAKGEAAQFYQWADRSYASSRVKPAGEERLSLEQVLDTERGRLAGLSDPRARAEAEVRDGAWLHRLVKAMLPNFSLERGFEFRHAVRYSERQCFLQSVLIAGMLQRMGADAGVVMVFRNATGQESNNGHAAVLLKLSDGRDALLDASDPQPYMRHRGLFARTTQYRFVSPRYTGATTYIVGYDDLGGRGAIATDELQPLDLAFVHSQFWYYRGERAPGGILAAHPTRAGLRASARYLEASAQANRSNPLAEYMLGRVYLKQGKSAPAYRVLQRAHRLYAQFGWVPEGPKQFLALAKQQAHARG